MSPAAKRPARTMRAAGSARVVLVTAPDEARGRALGRALVEEGLAACVNVIPVAASIYRWEGKVVEEPEALLVIKSTGKRVEALARRVRELHSYEVPEILALRVESGLREYLAWLSQPAGE
jgi:periplasmic divalent cation tolerance protein